MDGSGTGRGADHEDRIPEGLARLGRRRSVKAGTLLFQQDAQAAFCLFVESGELSLRRVSRNGDEVELTRIGPGEWCGEVIVFADSAYPAQAIVERDAEVLEFRKAEILASPDPEAHTFFLSLLANKCLRLTRRIEQLTIMDTRERLAQYILGLCPAHIAGCKGGLSACSFPFPRKKREIAEELGMAPETLSRTLRQLEGEGVIRLNGTRIEIASCDRLRRVTGGSA